MHTLYFGADHAAFDLKEQLLAALKDEYDSVDCGPTAKTPGDDYPDFAQVVCEKVLEHGGRGILLCDTGIGMSMAANRYEGIRAALVTNQFMAERSREHNDANVLCLGADVCSYEENEQLLRTWLQTDFSGHERHVRRIEKLDMLG